MKPLSVYNANVQTEIDSAKPLFETQLDAFRLEIIKTSDSLWLICHWPNRARYAIRTAYGFNYKFDVPKIEQLNEHLLVKLTTDIASYEIQLRFPESTLPVIHFSTFVKFNDGYLLPFMPRDVVPLTYEGKISNTKGVIHTQQIGTRSGQLFMSMTRPKNASLFYFQNLTALNDYCEATNTSAGETVGGSWPEIGFKLPSAKEKPIPPVRLCISDAFIVPVSANAPDELTIGSQFLNCLEAVYLALPKPTTIYRDWPSIAEKSLEALSNNKGCWSYSGGHPYLNAYLCDYKTPPESMVQLAVLDAVIEYGLWREKEIPVIDEIKAGLPAFFDAKIKTISRWLPALRNELDEEEEQKSAMAMDSWYLHHPLMNLSKLARDGDKNAEKLLMDSLEYAITAAHKFNYNWPIFYKMNTLEIIKKEAAPGKGGEKDVAGAYALLMFNVWKLRRENRYLDEAENAAKSLKGKGINVFYQANNTAFGALALLRLYKETKNELYLELSYNNIASILVNVQLWECDYGSGKYFPNFFGIFPLSDAPYKAAYEEMEVFAALNDYIKEAQQIEILPALTTLIPEMIRYGINRLLFYYPPMLHKGIFSDEIRTGEVDPNLWVPIEDLYDGWDQHGKVGQEVYGAGVGFGIVPRQYVRIPEGNCLIYTDYPITALTRDTRKVVFKIIGNPKLDCKIMLLYEGDKRRDFIISKKTDQKKAKVKGTALEKGIVFRSSGKSEITISWK